MAMDFGFGASTNNEEVVSTTETKEQVEENSTTQEEKEDLTQKEEKLATEETTEFAIEPGTQIEFDGKNYSVDDKGNIVDEQGNIFKEAKDVKEWKDSLETETTKETEVDTIKAIQDAIGIDITDEQGNVVEFENTPEGITSYVNQVIENTREENQKAAIETLFNQYPVIKDVLNYYINNGNSLEGFNQTPDRSSIEIDTNNIEQQENIIKTAWKEQGRKGDVNGYIEYLKSSGTLLNVAQEELEGLKQSDKEYREAQERQARQIEEEQKENVRKYWENVKTVIESKTLGDYTIPDTIVRTIDGKKIGGSREDFFNYVYRVDKDGKSAYIHDLEKESDEKRLNDELLKAYLKYTGGSYSNLVDMAINKKEVTRLKLASKSMHSKSVKFTPPTKSKSDKIDFGL